MPNAAQACKRQPPCLARPRDLGVGVDRRVELNGQPRRTLMHSNRILRGLRLSVSDIATLVTALADSWRSQIPSDWASVPGACSIGLASSGTHRSQNSTPNGVR